MSSFVAVTTTAELPPGTMRAFIVEGRKIVLCHTSRGFFATDSVCPHRGGPLAEGDLMGEEIVCSWHLWGFDVATGKTPMDPEVRLQVHEVKVEGDTILVKLSPPADSPFLPW